MRRQGGLRGIDRWSWLAARPVGKGQVVGADDAVVGFEQGGFKDGGEFAHVAGPAVLQEAGEGAGAEDDGALLIAGADAVEQGLGEQGNVFAALAQRRNGEADGGKAEGEVGQQQALAGHLAQRGLRGGEDDGAARRAVLERLEDAEQQTLAGRGEQVNAIQIGEAGEGGGVGVGDQPLAGVAALEAGAGQRGAAEEIAGQGVLAGAVFALDGGDLHMGRGHLSLHEELAPGGADADELATSWGESDSTSVRARRRKAGAGSERRSAWLSTCLASAARTADYQGQQWFHRRGGEKHEPERSGFSPVRVQLRIRRYDCCGCEQVSGSAWRARRRRSGRRGCGRRDGRTRRCRARG